MAAERTIVVVEDDFATAELLAELLAGEFDCVVVGAADGRTALEIARENRPQLILLDLRLPDMDGLELYEALQADARTSRVPVIFITASPDDSRLAERGITDLLAKPFDLDELVALVAAKLQPEDR